MSRRKSNVKTYVKPVRGTFTIICGDPNKKRSYHGCFVYFKVIPLRNLLKQWWLSNCIPKVNKSGWRYKQVNLLSTAVKLIRTFHFKDNTLNTYFLYLLPNYVRKHTVTFVAKHTWTVCVVEQVHSEQWLLKNASHWTHWHATVFTVISKWSQLPSTTALHKAESCITCSLLWITERSSY